MANQSYPLPCEMLKKWSTEIPDQVYLRQPVKGVYHEKTWAQVYDEVYRLAAGLKSLGLQKGDVVSILGKNTAEWFIADFAISVAGLISAPIYYTAGEDTISYILKHSEAKAIVIGKLDDTKPIAAAVADLNIIKIAQPYDTISCDHQMADLIKSNEPLADSDVFKADMEDTFSIIYTSGSTGNPKGVILTYKNIGFGGTSAVKDLNFSTEDRLISYLPLAHITERAILEYVSLNHGCTVTFNESLDTFTNDLRSANPSMFVSVPRLWMKFQTGILAKMPEKKLDFMLKVPILSSLVKNKIKEQLGLANSRLNGSGAAPISPGVLEWYRKVGLDISEGYGMSETSGLATVNFPFNPTKVGTVGKPAYGVEIKFSEEGEILVRSDGVVKGYYKEPEKTAETFIDGWLHTGDKGEMDSEGYLRITGRVKEIFKTGKGKYVTPVPIEGRLSENTFIEQICVMGAGMPQPIAVAVLAQDLVGGVSQDELKKSLADTLKKTNDTLEAHQKMSHMVVAKEAWTIENGLLTPTLKIKRSQLEKKYNDVISAPTREPVVMEQ